MHDRLSVDARTRARRNENVRGTVVDSRPVVDSDRTSRKFYGGNLRRDPPRYKIGKRHLVALLSSRQRLERFSPCTSPSPPTAPGHSPPGTTAYPGLYPYEFVVTFTIAASRRKLRRDVLRDADAEG
jgi:hypothetical protein